MYGVVYMHSNANVRLLVQYSNVHLGRNTIMSARHQHGFLFVVSILAPFMSAYLQLTSLQLLVSQLLSRSLKRQALYPAPAEVSLPARTGEARALLVMNIRICLLMVDRSLNKGRTQMR